MSFSSNLPEGFELVPCEICGHDERKLVVSRTDLFLGGNNVFYMHKCLGCGVVYQYPRPTPRKMADFYPPDYLQYTRSIRHERGWERFFRRYGLRKRGKVISQYFTQGSLLDVGCATGDFLSEMCLQPGWQIVGIEPGHTAVVYAHNEVGLDVVEGFLNDAPFARQTFDVITMWDVLEHVYDPRTVIRQAAYLIKPGGILVVNHPNLDSIDRRLFGNLWLGYELPRHLYLFPTDLLRRLMADVGFEEVRRECLYGSHAATSSSFMFVVERWLGTGRLSKIIRKLLFSKVVRILLIPYFKFVDHRLLGSNVTVIFQKRHESDNDGE
ncbi:MAG: class I SAM-dependent methyltransferase [Anaerolineae bacterium]